MCTVMEMIGLSPMGYNSVPAMDPQKDGIAFRCGEIILNLLKGGTKAKDVLTRQAFENAIASVAATGGSTNGVLHLLAMARESGVPLAIDDFDRISARTPLLADLKPGGRYVATDMHRAGGTRLLAQRLLEAGLLHGAALTVSGSSLAEEAARGGETAGQQVIR